MAGAGGEDAAGIGPQVLRFLLMRAGAEVKRPVEPYRRERRDVRPPVATYRGPPERLRLRQDIGHLDARRGRSTRLTESLVQLYGRLGLGHRRSPVQVSFDRPSPDR